MRLGKKKIIFFLSNLNGGGAQRTVVNIINKLDRSKFKPILAVLDLNENHPYYKIISKDLKILDINRRGRYSIPKIVQVIRKENPSVVFSTLVQVNIAVAIAHKVSGSNAKLILRETNQRDKNKMNVFRYKLIKWSYRYCDTIIALSNGVAEDIKKLYGINRDKIKVIFNPINIDFIETKSLDQHEVSSSTLNFLACGRLEEQKNFSLLLNGLAEFNKEFKDWQLYILGEGSQKELLINLAIKNKIEDKVYFTGFQENPYKYMRNADLFILTSKWEGFGHVIVEAMACGTPVLASDCPHGPSEILDNGNYGWLFKNNNKLDLLNKIREINYNKNNLHSMGLKARKRAQKYNINKIVSTYEKTFNE